MGKMGKKNKKLITKNINKINKQQLNQKVD